MIIQNITSPNSFLWGKILGLFGDLNLIEVNEDAVSILVGDFSVSSLLFERLPGTYEL